MQETGISLCMIVKDEELVLENCLASVKDLVAEIIIVDTGSTDNTKEIARKYGANIYDQPWENDFAKARNYSLSQAQCDWILLLDADEVLNNDDISKFRTLMDDKDYDGYHFTILNYLKEDNTTDYTSHYAFRFLRNTGEYEFTGNIHEQIGRIKGELNPARFRLADITLYHYGYISAIVKSKNKRERNMPLLKKALEENPDNPFFLFNIGNEYMADNEYFQALYYYEKSYDNINFDQAYTPHLFYRMILCYIELKNYDCALNMVFEGLMLYPECTDLEYLKAIIYHRTYSHLLAIHSLNKCIEMGEPPVNLKFLNDCATNRAYELLGEIYCLQSDYEYALSMFHLLYEKTKSPELLYKIVPLLNHLYEDKNQVLYALLQYLPEHNSYNTIYITKLLLHEKLFKQALHTLKELYSYKEAVTEYHFLSAKLNFYEGNYVNSLNLLPSFIEKELSQTALGNIYTQCLILHYLNHLYMKQPIELTFYNLIKDQENNYIYTSFQMLYTLLEYENLSDLSLFKNELLDEELFFQVIEEILITGKTVYLDKILEFLPYTNNETIYLKLARLYMKYDYKTYAIHAIYHSVKEYSVLDNECAFYLSRNL